MGETLREIVHEILDGIYEADYWNLDAGTVLELVEASGYDTTGKVDIHGRPIIMLENMGDGNIERPGHGET